ncbi:hypothetical protein PAPYR_804 [Paratrimastix pyriformis]|uniref:Uncharacterized protein n=1 Tax=Paratrimastix pyriformis TaxID=342808 RepID=A0ABQ8UXD9_9EUKA|nr:hypothetical protein PAPYR_804 [Paratrimastix pyriformis]
MMQEQCGTVPTRRSPQISDLPMLSRLPAAPSSLLLPFARSACACSGGSFAVATTVSVTVTDDKNAQKEKKQIDMAKIMGQLISHTQLINLHTTYRTALGANAVQHPLYSMVVPFLAATSGGIITNLAIHQRPIGWLVDNTPVWKSLLYWALTYHSPGDRFYKFFSGNQLVKDTFTMLDAWSDPQGLCGNVQGALDKYPGAPLGGFLAGVVFSCGGGATVGFLDARTRDPALKWLLSNPNRGLKMAALSSAAYIGLSGLLERTLPVAGSPQARKAHAQRVARGAVMALSMACAAQAVIKGRRDRQRQQADGERKDCGCRGRCKTT